MPKRRLSAQSKIEHYQRKIRRINKEEKQRRRIVSPLESSSEDEGNEEHGQTPKTTPEPISDPLDVEVETCPQSDEPAAAPDPGPEELDPELLTALGEFTSDTPDYGDNIHENLSKLWLPLLRKGMSNDIKDKIFKEYLVPDNCRLLQAPKLNPEISSAIPDMVRNRDKTLIVSQQQLGLGITAINRGIDILLKSDNKVQAMKHLSNGCRLLCDSHNTMTRNRVKLITPSLDKAFLHIINESERDETLFGSSLSEKIKAAKAIEKQGLQIKNQKPTIKPQKAASSSIVARPRPNQGNWTAPPRYPNNRGGRGGYRKMPMTSGVRRPYSTSTAPRRAATQHQAAAQSSHH